MRNLDLWEEIVGRVKEVEKEENEEEKIVVKMENGNEVILPCNKIDIQRLKSSIGKRIAIIRTDISEKEYLMREIE